MDGVTFREIRLALRLSQGDLKDELNRRLGRSYDKPKISRWENHRESIPDDVAKSLTAMSQNQGNTARVLVLSNQKGGVGKTTSALNLAYAMTQLGRRVLLVDMDPQATATAGLLADGSVELYRQCRTSAHLILSGRDISDLIVSKGEAISGRTVPFDLLASHIDLAETDGRREPGFDLALREALEPLRQTYDWIVVDAPPNLGMLTWMSLAAGDDAIVPVRTEPYDTMGVGLIVGTIGKIQRRINPGLRLSGILPTQFGQRKFVDREVLAHLINMMGERVPVLEPVPTSAIFGHAARAGRIALEASPLASSAMVYARLAQALEMRMPLPVALLQPTEV